ncbi:MAG: HNH endonuclease [Gammaproteobacteria bacterium]|nr:MAG: HNH endonuclease [Gammaproteobacteria bacterium]
MTQTLEMRVKRYDSFKKCIYCLKTFELKDLNEEHIIPFSLNGTLIIDNANCTKCGNHINKAFENPSSQADFLMPRLLLGLRRRNKNNAKKLYTSRIIFNDESDREVVLELKDYPGIVPFPTFEPPCILVGGKSEGHLTSLGISFLHLGLKRDYPYKQVEINIPSRPCEFALTLAKIAYCFAVAEKGLNYFNGDEMRDLILCERDDIFNFVGGPIEWEYSSDRQLHALSIRHRGVWVTVVIHLFASFGAQTYEVVVGKKN